MRGNIRNKFNVADNRQMGRNASEGVCAWEGGRAICTIYLLGLLCKYRFIGSQFVTAYFIENIFYNLFVLLELLFYICYTIQILPKIK
jgi:hypothetical protein